MGASGVGKTAFIRTLAARLTPVSFGPAHVVGHVLSRRTPYAVLSSAFGAQGPFERQAVPAEVAERISLVMDTDAAHKVVTEAAPAKRKALVADSADANRGRMKQVCGECHTSGYVDSFYGQYDDLVVLFNEKFAKPGTALMAELSKQGLLTKKQFDEKIEWEWFYLWHHEGRRARHGAAMMAPDYTHWHGMYEVAERFYQSVIPEARELAAKAAVEGKKAQADAVNALIDSILARPEHAWYLAEKASGAPVKAR